MTTPLPSPVTYGTVKCNVGKLVGDITGDPTPDIELINGKIRITPSVPTITVLGGSNNNYVLSTPPQEWKVISGKLRDRLVGDARTDDGGEGVRYIASTSAGKLPDTVQYKAEFFIEGVLKQYQPKPIVFNVIANQVIDLATIVPVQPVSDPVKVNSYEDRAFVQAVLADAQTAKADAIAAATAAGLSAVSAADSAEDAHAAIIILSGLATPVPPGTASGTVVVRTA